MDLRSRLTLGLCSAVLGMLAAVGVTDGPAAAVGAAPVTTLTAPADVSGEHRH